MLRVVSYNIHKGLNPSNRKVVLGPMRDALRELNPDLVFLQEVVGEHKGKWKDLPDWPLESHLEFLADSLWPHQAYGRNAVYDSGHHGNAVLSKFPIVEWRNISLTASRFESRGMLHVRVQLPKVKIPLHCLCVHLGLFARGRKKQLERILDAVRRDIPAVEPLILGGDFNDWSYRLTASLEKNLALSEVFRVKEGRHARSFPARLPILSLDRIFVRGFSVVDAQVLKVRPWSRFSDHAALAATLAATDK